MSLLEEETVVDQSFSWIMTEGIKQLVEKEGEKEILCECKWLKLWHETTFWNDTIETYVDAITKDTQKAIICEIGLTETIQYMIKDCDGSSLFYARYGITNYEAILCQYALLNHIRHHLDDIYDAYIDEVGGKYEDTYCEECKEDE